MSPFTNLIQRSFQSDQPVDFAKFAIGGGIASVIVVVVIIYFAYGCKTKAAHMAKTSKLTETHRGKEREVDVEAGGNEGELRDTRRQVLA